MFRWNPRQYDTLDRFIPPSVVIRLANKYWERLCAHEPFYAEWCAIVDRREQYPLIELPFLQRTLLYIRFWEELKLELKGPDPWTPGLLMSLKAEVSLPLHDELALFAYYLEIVLFMLKWNLPMMIQESIPQQLLFEAVSSEKRSELRLGKLRIGYSCIMPLIQAQEPTHRELPPYDPISETREAYRERALQVVEQYIREVEDFYRQAGWKGWNTLSTRLNEDYLETLALRVFMRVVERKSWSEIAKATNCSVSAACESTREGIRLLDIKYPADTD